jgi:uncharacterized protein (TIGR03437 family)
VAPGQLLTLFGSNLASEAAYDSTDSALPRTLGGATVLINGVAAPMLYASGEQINFVVPYEIAGRVSVPLELITAAGEHVRRTLPVTAADPALITLGESDYPACQGTTVEGASRAVVLNPDGTRNSCENPAPKDSTVSVFLTGAGAVPPAVTGVNRAGGVSLESALFDGFGNEVQRAFAVDWAPLGVWQIDVRVRPPSFFPPSVSAATAIQLVVDGTVVRTGPVAVWLRP